jgi:hypothetical protein
MGSVSKRMELEVGKGKVEEKASFIISLVTNAHTEPVVEDVCLAVKRQVEAERQAALKERARLLPNPPAPAPTEATIVPSSQQQRQQQRKKGGGLSPTVAAQQALHRLRASLEGLPLLTADDLRQLTAQALAHVGAFVRGEVQATTAPGGGCGDDGHGQGQEAVDLGVTAHALLAFVLQHAAAAAERGETGAEGDGDGEALGSLTAARAAVRELVRAMPSLWRRLLHLEDGALGKSCSSSSSSSSGGGGVRALVQAFCRAHCGRLVLALQEWHGWGNEAAAAAGSILKTEGKVEGQQCVVAGWWLEAMGAGVLTPPQVEAAWLSYLGSLAAASATATAWWEGAAARLVREYHSHGAASGYHRLHFSRLQAIVRLSEREKGRLRSGERQVER